MRSDVHSHLFRAVSKYKEKDDLFTCCLNWGATVTCHDTLKSYKTLFIVWISFFLLLKGRPCFIPEVTCSVFSVGVLSVFSLFPDVFFTVWEHERHGLLNIATVTKEDGFSRRVNSDFYTCNSEFISQFCLVFLTFQNKSELWD